ncbi:peptide-methionine (R)-S-oxide reductase MsrB [Flavobacterium sp. NKUCC04_CG]|nr:peptide-methionine (R)-S-oxide reductase MsrB [Flavobacterium sp. NKUCC04_CG]MBW3519624.1 peptide-methionine (R)-S-oxide reductase MsrB [Flavobacterium sp. NKUCC04_CG]
MKTYSLLLLLLCFSCQQKSYTQIQQPMKTDQTTDQQWKEQLTPEEYYVLRQKGTERPFSGVYNDFYEKGIYVCAACGNKIFESDNKFDGHCGWPSFDQAVKESVLYVKDISHGMQRTEVICANCKGHLGHVFEDGPKDTTGNRYCMNSVSMKFIPQKEIKK